MATITKRGKRWRVQVRREGRSISRTFSTKREAQQFASGIEHDVLTGKYVAESVTLSLRAAMDTYDQQVAQNKKSYRQERPRIREWQDVPFATLPLDKVTPTMLSEWRDTQLATRKPATVRLKLALLSHVYTTALKEWGIPVTNPVSQMRLPSTAGNGRDRRLRPGEFKQLIRSAELTHPELPTFIRLAVLTGMRRGELSGLCWEDVDLPGRRATLHDTKNGTRRVVPLGRRAVKVLEDYQGYVCGRTGRLFDRHPHRFTAAFKKACDRVGIEGLTLHDLRHEATSRLFEKGLSIVEVAAITGHKSLSMLQRYTHPDVSKMADKL